jgi:hypothetical protein
MGVRFGLEKTKGGQKAAIHALGPIGFRELEPCKAEAAEKAECTFVHEHFEAVSNAAGPTRSKFRRT